MSLIAATYRGASTCSLPSTSPWIEDVGVWLETNWDWFDPSHAHRLFWPDRPYQPGMEILVAGCGPVQAAVIAYTNPDAHVTAIDIDEAAINHETYLRHKHKLLNLDANTLRPLPLEKVTSLNKSFDLIIASGVIELLDSAELGMQALADVLRPEGVLALTLPSQQLTGAPTPGGAKAGFSVQECLGLVEDAGLVFQDWVLKTPYYAPTEFEFDDELRGLKGVLSERQVWSLMESLRNQSGRHLLTACRPERAVSSYRIDFAASDAPDFVPQGRPNSALNESYAVRPGFSIRLTESELAMAREADGTRSIREIADRTNIAGADAIEFFERLWRSDFIAIRLP